VVDAKSVLAMFALTTFALLSGVLLLRAEREQQDARPRPALGAGYYLLDARLAGTGDDGRVRYRLSADSVTQTQTDGSIDLHRVALDYDPGAELPWNVRADTGRILPDGKMIELTGNVVAATRDSEGPSATIRTDYLEFDPDSYVAATDRKVIIDYAGSIVHATGMRARLREDRLELLSEVNGHYVP
jgi:lipopolysaccharide export system protein LptC